MVELSESNEYSPGSSQIEYVIDAVAENACAGTNTRVRPGMIRISALNYEMIRAEVADKNASGRSRERIPWLSRVLESFVDHFKQLSLRRVHRLHLERTNTKESMVEEPGIFSKQEASFGGNSAWVLRIGMVESLAREAVVTEFSVSRTLVL